MPKNIYYLCLLFILVASLSSCQKVVDVKLSTAANQIVIEGAITDFSGEQTIRISQSVPYTSSNNYPAVTGAQVSVKDDTGRSYSFVETQPGIYTINPLKAVTGRTYTMTALVNNVTYTASSTTPALVNIDSLSIKIVTFGGADIKEVEVHFKDPADQVNQYRWVMKVDNVQIKSVYADNDRLTNGNTVTNVLFYDDDDNEKLKKGDMVTVDMQCIDKAVFNYWYVLSQQSVNGPGGGVSPGNPPSNIDHNALGYFSAQTSSVRTFTVF